MIGGMKLRAVLDLVPADLVLAGFPVTGSFPAEDLD